MNNSCKQYELKLNQLCPASAYAFLQKFISTIGIETIENNLSDNLGIVSKFSTDLNIFAHLNKSAKNLPVFKAIIRTQVDLNQYRDLISKLAAKIEDNADSFNEKQSHAANLLVETLEQALELGYDQTQTTDLIVNKMNECIIEDTKDQYNFDRITDFCEFENVMFDKAGNFFVGTSGKYYNVDKLTINTPVSNCSIHSLKLAIAIHESIEVHKTKELILASETNELCKEYSKFFDKHQHLYSEVLTEIFDSNSADLLIEVSPVFGALRAALHQPSANYFFEINMKKKKVCNLTSWDSFIAKLTGLNTSLNSDHRFNIDNSPMFNLNEVFNFLSNNKI